jgi:uncharacterized protein YndB with AHSA1/START domain
MLRAPEPTVLLIADVSGYTSYLAGSELDHAQDVLTDLLQTVTDRLAPPFNLAAVEGDACFVAAPAAAISGALLLDTIDACYFGFRRRLRDIGQATTCTCNACVLIPRLGLKFVAHHGHVVRQVVGGRENLAGSDVIAVHRLLKNSITDSFGFRAYTFFSQAAAVALGLACGRMGMTPHAEDYDVGRVEGYVEDLEARWQTEESRGVKRLSAEYVRLRVEADLPAPPPIAWEWVTSPRLRPRWQSSAIRVDQNTTDGRPGPGTTNHCVHGKDVVLEQILDWHPFQTFTDRSHLDGFGELDSTTDFEATATGTHVVLQFGGVFNRVQRLKWLVARRMISRILARDLPTLSRLIADEVGGDVRSATTPR